MGDFENMRLPFVYVCVLYMCGLEPHSWLLKYGHAGGR